MPFFSASQAVHLILLMYRSMDCCIVLGPVDSQNEVSMLVTSSSKSSHYDRNPIQQQASKYQILTLLSYFPWNAIPFRGMVVSLMVFWSISSGTSHINRYFTYCRTSVGTPFLSALWCSRSWRFQQHVSRLRILDMPLQVRSNAVTMSLTIGILDGPLFGRCEENVASRLLARKNSRLDI